MSATRAVTTEGADILYDIEGQGPLLLLIAGGNGDSKLFVPLSAHMRDRYTVVRYDRRANARSTGDRKGEMDMAQAGRDAAAVIQSVDLGPAFVFGSSAGANIALALTQDHPHRVRGLVDHEPPISDFLPQPAAGTWRAFFDRVYDTYLAEGTGPAMRLFATALVGFDPNAPAPGDQVGNQHDRFLAHEFVHINHFVPDLEALRRSKVPMVTAVGRESGDAFYVQTARELSRRLPCRCVDMVGNHLGYGFHPKAFAEELHGIIQSLNGGAT